MTPLRVLFFGTPEFAVPTLDALLAAPDVAVVGVVTQPDKPRGRGQHVSAVAGQGACRSALGSRCCSRRGSPTRPSSTRCASWRADLGVVAAYGRLLPEACWRCPALGLVNVHASLLPRWRGASPIERAIIAGDARPASRSCGWSRRSTPARCCRSPRRRSIPTRPAPRSKRGLAAIGAELLAATLPRIARGTAVEEPQDEARVTLAPRITKSRWPRRLGSAGA